MREVLARLARGWKSFAHRLGRVQSTLLLGLVYLFVIPPFSLVRWKDPLRRELDESGGFWEPMEPVDDDAEDAARRF